MKRNLAIFSPNQNAYSETFIQAHKQLPFNTKFYYGGWFPFLLESGGNLFKFNLAEKIKIRLYKNFNLSEHALMNSLRREKIDVVLAEYGPMACATLKVVQKLKLPLVVHFHGFDTSEKKTLDEFYGQYQQVFKYAASVIAVSNKMKQMLIELGCPEKKICLTPCGPAPSFLSLSPVYDKPTFIAVGRFVEKKGPQFTILAFKKVVEKCPDALLTMVGEGALLSDCISLATELQIEKNIKFAGILGVDEIQKKMQQSLAFVQHSVVADSGDSEGTPVSILEAQAAALPVISTNHAGIPDVVLDEVTGLLTGEKDIDGMAANMIRLIREPSFAASLGAAARKRIKEHFLLEKHLAAVEQELNNAIIKNKLDN